jgi:hypothetical protein
VHVLSQYIQTVDDQHFLVRCGNLCGCRACSNVCGCANDCCTASPQAKLFGIKTRLRTALVRHEQLLLNMCNPHRQGAACIASAFAKDHGFYFLRAAVGGGEGGVCSMHTGPGQCAAADPGRWNLPSATVTLARMPAGVGCPAACST